MLFPQSTRAENGASWSRRGVPAVGARSAPTRETKDPGGAPPGLRRQPHQETSPSLVPELADVRPCILECSIAEKQASTEKLTEFAHAFCAICTRMWQIYPRSGPRHRSP